MAKDGVLNFEGVNRRVLPLSYVYNGRRHQRIICCEWIATEEICTLLEPDGHDASIGGCFVYVMTSLHY